MFQSSTFGKIPTLLNVDLSDNRLKRVKRGAFGGLASLRSINLENNQLVEIPSPSISLTHLHLANNNITKIKGRAPWPVMNSIIYIDLNNNRLGDSLDGGKCSEHSLQLSKPTMSQCQFWRILISFEICIKSRQMNEVRVSSILRDLI